MCFPHDPQTDPARLRSHFSVEGLPLGLKPSLWPGYHGPFVRKHELADVGDKVVPSYTILTIDADDHPFMKHYHKPQDEKRMVMILHEEEYDA